MILPKKFLAMKPNRIIPMRGGIENLAERGPIFFSLKQRHLGRLNPYKSVNKIQPRYPNAITANNETTL